MEEGCLDTDAERSSRYRPHTTKKDGAGPAAGVTLRPRERRCLMFKKCLTGLALTALLVWTASAQDAKTVIGNASKAMGVDTLKTVQFSATTLDFALGRA